MSDSPASRRSPGIRFVITALVSSAALFGLLRLPIVEERLLLPFTQAQFAAACRLGADPNAPISVGLSCSAADVIALCLGFILAFPVSWRRRLSGAGLGLLLIAGINTVRIATLSHAVHDRKWFDLLHLYLWPGVLLIAVSVYVFLWMSRALRRDGAGPAFSWSNPFVRFAILTGILVGVFVATSSMWMTSEVVLAVAHRVAATAAFIIRAFGGTATVAGNTLRTGSGSYVVTQECIMTPLIPAYFAAVLALPLDLRKRLVYGFASLPVFFLLGVARLLVLAIPAHWIGSPQVAIHAFFQVMVAVVVVLAAAFFSHPPGLSRWRTARRAVSALAAALLAAAGAAVLYNPVLRESVAWLQSLLGHAGHVYLDPQGAVLLAAPYQWGLLVALWLVGSPRADRRRFLQTALTLVATQVTLLLLIGEWTTHIGVPPHIALIRSTTLVMVLLLAAWMQPDFRRASLRRFRSQTGISHG